MEISCYVCNDTGIDGSSACARCRKQERRDQIAARKAAEKARQEAIDPRRFLAQVQERSKATETAYLLAIVLATRADRYGRVSTPPDALARICRCSRRSVFNALAELVSLGELVHVRKGGKNHEAVYRLVISQGAV